MNNEADFKRVFKKSVKAQKGYSISLAAPMLSGIPDLYVLMPGFIPVLLEAKWMKELKYGFEKKIPYTALQKNFINECNNVYNCTAFGLIGFKYEKNIWCIMTTRDTISSRKNTSSDYLALTKETKLFDINLLFTNSGVPKLNNIHA